MQRACINSHDVHLVVLGHVNVLHVQVALKDMQFETQGVSVCGEEREGHARRGPDNGNPNQRGWRPEGCFLNDLLNKEVKSIFIKEVNFWANLIKKVKSIFNKEVNSKKGCFLNDVFNAI